MWAAAYVDAVLGSLKGHQDCSYKPNLLQTLGTTKETLVLRTDVGLPPVSVTLTFSTSQKRDVNGKNGTEIFSLHFNGTIEPIKPIKQIKWINLIKQIKPTKRIKQIKLIKMIKPIKLVDLIKLINLIKPSKWIKQMNVIKPIK